MRYVAAYLLVALAGKTPTAKDLKKVLETAGVEAEDDEVQTVIDNLSGKDLDELIEEGKEKLATVPSGGGGAVASSAGGAAAPAEEEKKEEKKEESEESDDDMGFGLFD